MNKYEKNKRTNTTNDKQKILTKTWYDRTVNAAILPLALCWKHDSKKPFLRQPLNKNDITQNTQIQKIQCWHQKQKAYHI